MGKLLNMTRLFNRLTWHSCAAYAVHRDLRRDGQGVLIGLDKINEKMRAKDPHRSADLLRLDLSVLAKTGR